MQVTIESYNSVYLNVDFYSETDASKFSALVSEMIPNFNIIKKKNYAKFKHWDGIIKYYNPNNGMLFKGLYSKLIRFCKENHIQVNDLQTDTDGVFDLNYFKKLKINDYNEKEQHYYSIEPDKYQMEALEKSLVAKNLRIQVATGGGKTLYSYLLIHYLKTIVKGKIVIVVPRQDLANQVHTKYGYYSHFDDNFNMEDVSIVHSKSKHSPNNKIIFITFQTLVNYEQDFFSDIDVLIVDEAHKSENKSLKSIISKCVNTKYKIGMSGTFESKEDTLSSDLCLQAMLGDMVNIVGQRDLINAGRASEFEGRVYVIKHRDEDVKRYKSLMNDKNKKHKIEYDVLKNIKDKKVSDLKQRISEIHNGYKTGDVQRLENQLDYLVNTAITTENKRWGYADEVDFLKNLEARNHFIMNTALSNDKGNSLVVFNHIETHGDVLHDLALTKMRKYDINLFYIHGNTKLRPDKATALIESSNKRVVVLANLSMVKEGWSVNNLHFCYVSMSLKSSKALTQLAGRLLRKDGTNTKTAIYIFIDDLRSGDYVNYSYEHGVGNIKTLMLENHEVKKMTIDLNEYFKKGK